MAKKHEIRTCVFYDAIAEREKDEDYGCMGHWNPGNSDSPYCPRCRANMGYWQRAEKRRPGSMRRYRNKLACRHARLDEWSSSPRKTSGKVVYLNTRTRKHG